MADSGPDCRGSMWPSGNDSTTGTAAVVARGAARAATPRLRGVTLEAAPSPSSPTCTSTTTTVMLSAPPCPLAASTSRSSRLGGVVDLAQNGGDFIAAHLVGEPVRAQEQPVAGAEPELPHVGVDLGGHPESTREDVPLGMDRRLLFGHFALAHALLGQAVVVGDLGDVAPGEEVSPGVTDIGQRQHVLAPGPAHQRHRGECGPHATEIDVDLTLVPHRGVGLREGLEQSLDGRRPFERLFERLDRDPGRHLAADVTAHAVSDGVEIGALQRQILVDVAHPSHVGGGPRPQHRQRETSKTVEPIWRRSPLPSRTACVICSEFTNVPLVEPRSSTQSWSLRRKRRACSVDV